MHDRDVAPDAGQEPGDLVDRADGGREPDPLRRTRQELLQALERDRQVSPALRPDDGVDLVDDHRLDGPE